MSGEVIHDDGPDGDQRLAGMLFSPEARADPYPLYRTVDVPGCRHATAAAMLKDPRLGPPKLDEPATGELLWTTFERWLLNLDGDRHRGMRQRFSRIFTPRKVEQYRSTIASTAQALLDAVIDAGHMDLVTDFALPLPFSVITDVLGVPPERRAWLAEQMRYLDTGFEHRHEPGTVRRASAAVEEMLTYFTALLDARTASPEDDLMSLLAADSPTDDEDRADLVANCIFFVEAGHVTTSSLITGATLLLLQHPEQLARLHADPELVRLAVEEALRMVSPVSVVLCQARVDVQIDGYRLTPDRPRIVFPAGANRDGSVFSEPDRFDIARAPNPHLAFSAGAHFCLGAPLARLHGEVALATLLERLPDLELAGEPQWLGSIPLRVPQHLPVRWRPAHVD
jgi:cytochrome P450